MSIWRLLLASVLFARIPLFSQAPNNPVTPERQQKLQDFERQFNGARNDPARLNSLKRAAHDALSADDLRTLAGMLAADEAHLRSDPVATNPTYSVAVYRGLDPNV